MRMRLVILVAVLVLAAGAVYVVSRAATSVVAEHVGPMQISAECTGWTGVTERCREWGEAVLAAGAPSTTFELEDVVRIRLDRPTFGLAGRCTAEYFVGRYPDEVAWTEDVDCL
jgi:hypothetical protein